MGVRRCLHVGDALQLMFLVFLRGLVERQLDDVGDRSGVDFSGAGRKEL